jgi:hypothetical protein
MLARTMTAASMTQSEALDEMARTLGLSVRQIQRYLRLTQLAPAVQRDHRPRASWASPTRSIWPSIDSCRPPGSQVPCWSVEESLSAAELSRLCQALALQRHIIIDPAYGAGYALRRGERIASSGEHARRNDYAALTPAPPPTDTDGAAGDAPWDDDETTRRKRAAMTAPNSGAMRGTSPQRTTDMRSI